MCSGIPSLNGTDSIPHHTHLAVHDLTQSLFVCYKKTS